MALYTLGFDCSHSLDSSQGAGAQHTGILVKKWCHLRGPKTRNISCLVSEPTLGEGGDCSAFLNTRKLCVFSHIV